MTQPRTCPVAAFQLSTPCSKVEARPPGMAYAPLGGKPRRPAGPRTSSTGCSVGTPPPGRCEAESSGTAWLARTAGPSGLVGPASGPTTGARPSSPTATVCRQGQPPHTVYPCVLITGRLLGHYLGITTLE